MPSMPFFLCLRCHKGVGTIVAINQQYPDLKKNQESIGKRPFSVLSRRFIELNGEVNRESESGARENPDSSNH